MTLPSDFPLEPPTSNKEPHRDYRGLDRGKLTPMYQHYVEVKETYPNALLLYRVGDFFECFFQDAVIISRELELVLTSKEGGKGIGRVAMTGVPHHALERYSRLLVEKGYAVAICDQVEDSTEAAAEKRLVERAITKLLTPGTLTDEGMLNAKKNNFLAAVVITGENWGLAYSDISTGEFYTTQASDLTALSLELSRLQPSEILFPINAPDLNRILRPGEKSDHLPPCLPDSFCYSLRPQTIFTLTEAKNRLLITYKMRSLEGMGCEHLPLAIRAAGGLLEYIEDTQKANQVPLQPLKTYSISEFLILDGQTRRNLEITQTVRDGSFYGSLLWAIDRTCTAMGSRALRRWLLQPLLDSRGIRARQDTIQELKDNPALRQDIRQKLGEIYDIERLSGRVGAGTANARDLLSLAASLVKLADLAALVASGNSPYLKALQQIPADLEKLGQQVIAHLVESPPLHLKEGGVIRSGIDAQLDALRRDYQEVIDWFKNLETTEKERTGISNLKVNYNKTFGYYISLPRSKADFAPKEYVRKQTLVNEERYITTELKEKENIILTAVDELNKLEYEIFSDLRRQVAEFSPEIREVATKVAALDVLAALAEIAVYQGYCRPEIADGRLIDIKDGRHPVVEQSLGAGFFVPNSINLGNQEGLEYPDLIILTGPNASGKSCYLRQVGLIQLLAQTGSFVPAKSAKISICDRIFTRVGAVDDLATGQSTFMVEMNETANILNHATDRSLVLLDEIGRGTATFDGLSIAWSVAEYLATVLQSRTIFATHYHELNEMTSLFPRIHNFNVSVKEVGNKVIFLRKLSQGGSNHSFGIHVARMAGMPNTIVDRANEILAQLESKHIEIPTT
ncbi:MAG: hypothetical protein RLZZ143_1573, partial [Cyanobacteriota bacterium]